jgi:2-polyprenyl-3-methyl-5-hydroxy-6-metoxy-1,4-benzoquinol methylase
MASIIDERGFNQGFILTNAQQIRLHRRAVAIVAEMRMPAAPEARKQIHILELGCGTGELAHHLAVLTGARVTGVDLSAKFIDAANATYQHPDLSFTVMDLSSQAPASAQDQYNYIVGNGILHHLYNHLDSFLPALGRWLSPGGRLIFWEPNLLNPYVFLIFSFPWLRRWARLEPDEMAFTRNYIRKRLILAGFNDSQVSTRDFLLPNTPEILIKPVISAGRILERIPVVRSWAQSVFLSALKT